MSSTNSNSFNLPNEPRVIKRTTRTLPDGTVEVTEEYETVYPTYNPDVPRSLTPLHGFNVKPKHSCPLTDPANAGKPMSYYCPECHGVRC